MKIKQFDVVELKNKNKAIIKKVISKKEYLTQIINGNDDKIQEKVITDKDIERVIYSKEKER